MTKSNSAAAMRREALRNAIRCGIDALSTPLEREIWRRFCEAAKVRQDVQLLPELLVRISTLPTKLLTVDGADGAA